MIVFLLLKRRINFSYIVIPFFLFAFLSCQHQAEVDTLYPIYIDGNWGFINQNGAEIIAPQYSAVKNFSEGLAACQKDGLWGFINPSGDWIINPKYRFVRSSFQEEIAIVGAKINGKRILLSINPKGDTVFYNLDHGPFYAGRAILTDSTGRSCDYISKTGKVVFSGKDFNCNFCSGFSDGLALLSNKEEYIFVDTNGNKIFSLPHSPGVTFGFSDGLCLYYPQKGNSEIFYYNEKGEIAFKITSGGLFFKEGIMFSHRLGFIDKKGQILFYIENIEEVSHFQNGHAIARLKTGTHIIINNKGEQLAEIENIRSSYMNTKLIKVVFANQEWGYIDYSGKIIWRGEMSPDEIIVHD